MITPPPPPPPPPGMFPYVMLVTSAIFCDPSWPRDFPRRCKKLISSVRNFILRSLPNSFGSSSCASSAETSTDSRNNAETTSNSETRSDGSGLRQSLDRCQLSPSCIYSARESKSTSIGTPVHTKPSRAHKRTVIALSIYIGIQLFLPWSHFITKGTFMLISLVLSAGQWPYS